FRPPSTRSFSFSLPDNTQKPANPKVVFGHLTSSSSSLKITSNGKLSAGVQSATLAPPVSSSLFMLSSTVENSFSDLPETLNLTLNFQGGGSITMARLDYIEVEWDRALQLRNGQLYFYDYARTSTRYNISGCNAKTKIWDVTDPADIKEIKYDLNGSTASFVSVGNHEYVAFDCSAGNAVAVVGSVPNQDIHALPTPDMVIISPKEFLEAANKVAEMRRRVDGFTVHVLTPSLIYNEFSSGKKDASAFRKLLKMWYDRESSDNPKIKYCLLMGRPFYDQKQQTDKGKSLGYETLPAWQTEHEATEPTSYSTDDFIGMIDDGGKAFSIQSENIRVAVGRFPVTTAAEANQAATKLINYVENPILGPWRNEVMVIADDQDNGIHLEQAKDVVSGMRSKGNGYHFDYEQLYLDAYPLEYNGLGAIYLQAKERMMNKFEEGVAIVDYIGHANPVSWGHEHLLTWADIIGFSNKKFPFLVGATCNFGCWDEEDKCGAEVMWLNPSGGIIGGMIATRTVFISANGVLNKQFSSKVFERDHENKPKSFGKMMIEAKNGYPNDDNKLRFALYGDPALRVTSPTHEVIVDAINDTDFNNIQSAEDYPELMARQKIVLKGSILNPDGSEATDFNGELQFKLWDAEKVITTLGNGEKGVVSDYNDRKNILSRGATIIKNGKWETELRIPSEIDYNYSPARFTFYAVSEDGVEANGSDERFYVYGYDTSADDDTTGPEISLFAINNPAFKDGSVIGTAANVLAEFSDESGINLSTAGIGHSISLCLDNKTYYNNILQFYSPDTENPNKGSFSYPISGLSAGEHTLTLTVWDNANNSSRATLKFNTSVNRAPEIITLSADRAPAKTEVNLLVDINSDEGATCQLDVLDLQGKILWSDEARLGSINDSKISFRWNLTNRNGVRVDRGIYIYRATVISPNGARTSKSSRIAVAAQ
ncbi:MAG: type IX secretion system sortase PorU, partial [Muribaculaceae bacterium]|nr:type IX secretion system sortase PorU [Muribaculaceae bacterium]